MKERILDRSDTIVGFAARAKGTNKWVRNKWSGGAQTGTNVQTLTNDRTKMSIDEKRMIEIYCEWYNHNHKEKVEFEIVEVSMCTKTVVDLTILSED
jgi:hypothetical protein